MKRYVCTVAAALALALCGAGTASASGGLPLPGQSGDQKIEFGNQTVGEQTNDADVTQEQGNGNLNIAPAIGLFGDAETKNEQGNGNVAKSEVDQNNDVDQTQSLTQKQSVSGEAEVACCDGQSQTGEQKTSFGDQSVGKQKNDADVMQKQGNGNVNVSPAIAIFGDAETKNKQGNGNYAKSDVEQKNDVDQAQESTQKQSLEQNGSGGGCCGGQSQTGEQRVYGGDQSVEKQRNDADVNQWQGNGNVNISPAIAVFGDAETRNYQGNGNVAKSGVDQNNDVDQSQSSTQKQELTRSRGSCCEPKGYGKHGYSEKGCCEPGSSQTGEQKTSFGAQTVGEQKNDADVTQKQGNDNESFAPAIAIGGKKHGSCYSKCGKSGYPDSDGAETKNAQGNGNVAKSYVDQKNDVDQSQTSYQHQTLVQKCTGLIDH